jgi:putative MATE family efflux protein
MMEQSALDHPAITAPVRTLWQREMRATLTLAWPIIGANLLQMAVFAVDVVFVARLGTVEFAAATLGVFLISLIMWALMGLTSACAPLIAAERGRRLHSVREVRRSARMALWLGVLASLPFMLVLSQGEAILLLTGQNPHVAARADDFLDIILFALVSSVTANTLRTIAAALDRPRWALIITAFALAVGIMSNWLLVFGNGGFPALGLEGSAMASVVTSIATLLAYIALFLFEPHLRRYRLFGRWWRSEWARMMAIVRLGVPIALGWTMEGALFGGAAVLMGRLGVTEVAAHAVALNIAALAFQVPLGVAQAATIRVGLSYGAQDRAGMARAGWAAIILGPGFMMLTALLMWFAPLLLIGLYLDLDNPENAATIAMARQFLVIAALFQLFDGAQVAIAGALRGLQDTRIPMIMAGFGYWVAGFGTAVLLGFHTGLRGQGIWIGLAAGLLVVSALLLSRWAARERLGLVPGLPGP